MDEFEIKISENYIRRHIIDQDRILSIEDYKELVLYTYMYEVFKKCHLISNNKINLGLILSQSSKVLDMFAIVNKSSNIKPTDLNEVELIPGKPLGCVFFIHLEIRNDIFLVLSGHIEWIVKFDRSLSQKNIL